MFFFVWLFYVRFCAYQGSKRVIGGWNGLLYGMFFGILGIFIIIASRRLDDKAADARLLLKYKQC